MAWRDGDDTVDDPGDNSLYLSRFDAAGQPLAEPVLIAAGGVSTTTLAWFGGEYLVLWRSREGVFSARVGARASLPVVVLQGLTGSYGHVIAVGGRVAFANDGALAIGVLSDVCPGG